jgi:hypothetical protein
MRSLGTPRYTFPTKLYHKIKRESAFVKDYETHKKMGEFDYVSFEETTWKDELAKLEEEAIKARELRSIEDKAKEELKKIQDEKEMLLKRLAAKKLIEQEKALLEEARKACAEEDLKPEVAKKQGLQKISVRHDSP